MSIRTGRTVLSNWSEGSEPDATHIELTDSPGIARYLRFITPVYLPDGDVFGTEHDVTEVMVTCSLLSFLASTLLRYHPGECTLAEVVEANHQRGHGNGKAPWLDNTEA